MTYPPLPLWEIVQTHHVVARHFRALFAEHELTPNQFGVLACLVDGDDFTKAQLARAILVTPQSMDPIIQELLQRGLVERDGPPRRGRAAGIRITDLGLRLMALLRPQVVNLNSASRIGIPPEQIPLLVRQLQAIRKHLDDSAATY